MGQNIVTVARFSVPVEAEMARSRLEAEGIRAGLIGDVTGTTFAILAGQLGCVELQVSEDDAERAREILAECLGEDEPAEGHAAVDFPDEELPPDAVQARPEQVAAGGTRPLRPVRQEEAGAEVANPLDWTCPDCQARVSHDRTTCHICGAATTRVQTSDDALTRPPMPATPEEDQEDLSPEALQRRFSDDLARRAFRAALIGLLLPFLFLHVYSAYLILRLCLLPGELSPYARRLVFWTLLIDVPMLLILGLIVRLFCCGVR